ncbi:hypothetical protein CLV54_0543 [Compostimonas suwonensis]|uniref:Uncharacterized protein n=1 Tax=Compostimonas suwonensis TaxID=1048394 RepID=A0A2M9C4Q0_9MICO|nr:hypothetical protein CLV54_0543 [Compostimonas suwonensis]
MIVLGVVAAVIVPIVTHTPQGYSTQRPADDDFASTVSADGDDGRTRVLSVFEADGVTPADAGALTPGERLVVRGEGYDASRGVYVGLCRIPDAVTEKPSPCIGGVPEQSGEPSGDAQGEQQFAASNWINDDWAWKLFASRGYDDPAAGTFTAYLEVPVADEVLDCAVERCAIYTRNDHTAASDRVQDVGVAVRFAG